VDASDNQQTIIQDPSGAAKIRDQQATGGLDGIAGIAAQTNTGKHDRNAPTVSLCRLNRTGTDFCRTATAATESRDHRINLSG
jgi:hypothetical protein